MHALKFSDVTTKIQRAFSSKLWCSPLLAYLSSWRIWWQLIDTLYYPDQGAGQQKSVLLDHFISDIRPYDPASRAGTFSKYRNHFTISRR